MTKVAIPLVDLRGEHLFAISQDDWLTHCNPTDYLLTRQWARAMRAWDSSVWGFIWQPRHPCTGSSIVLYEDRSIPGAVDIVHSVELDSGSADVDHLLRSHHVMIEP